MSKSKPAQHLRIRDFYSICVAHNTVTSYSLSDGVYRSLVGIVCGGSLECLMKGYLTALGLKGEAVLKGMDSRKSEKV